jgi:hypothetical protein
MNPVGFHAGVIFALIGRRAEVVRTAFSPAELMPLIRIAAPSNVPSSRAADLTFFQRPSTCDPFDIRIASAGLFESSCVAAGSCEEHVH